MAGAPPPPPDPWYVLRGHQVSVSAISFYDPPGAPPGTLLLSGDVAGGVKVWDLPARRAAAEASEEHARKGVLAVLPLPSGEVAVHGREGTLSIMAPVERGTATLTQTAVLGGLDDRPGGLCFCPAVVIPGSPADPGCWHSRHTTQQPSRYLTSGPAAGWGCLPYLREPSLPGCACTSALSGCHARALRRPPISVGSWPGTRMAR
mmetsp:Transcript_35869/g.107815  ORF Transcript_35869/g.107815 Transcript_35869/m.107815 type:complete len:205 (+) Transcript_35869:1-615(+)